jgi:hypothetical protein
MGPMSRLDPEVAVEVLYEGEWRPAFAYYRQRLEDGWWYSVRLHWPIEHTRLLFVRYPDQVRKREEGASAGRACAFW